MSDKIVQEFIQRLNRTKSSLADAERQCEFLKKEAAKLESVPFTQELASKEFEQSEYMRIEDNLKVHYISSKVRNEEEFERNNLLHEELLRLRAQKRTKQREKDMMLKEHEKLTQELVQLQQQREHLDTLAKSLSQKLDQASEERLQAQREDEAKQRELEELTATLQNLKVNCR